MRKIIQRIFGLSALLCCIAVGQSAMARESLHVDGYSIYGALSQAEAAKTDSAVSETEASRAVAEGTNYIVPRIVNNTSEDRELIVAAAVYNKNGSLDNVSGYKIVSVGKNSELYPRIHVNAGDGKEVKAFVWDTKMNPVDSNIGGAFKAIAGTETYKEINADGIEIASMFTDNMVVQRNQDVKLWGKTNADKITAFFVNPLTGEKLGGSCEATINGGEWTVSLGSYEYDGNSYEIVIESEKNGSVSARRIIKNIVFGDVYLCSGQSNMEYEMLYHGWTDCHKDLYKSYEMAKDDNGAVIKTSKGSITPINVVYSPKLVNSNVRVIENMNTSNITENYSTDTDGWHLAEAKTLENFSATATYFGFEVEESTNVPVGLIQSAVGGSGISNWAFNPTYDAEGNVIYNGNHGILYKRQISAYTKGPIGLSGVIWYQGCADGSGTGKDSSGNVMTFATYTKTMEQMVNSWREKFNLPKLPFMYVQLASYTGTDYKELREAQLNYRMGVNTNDGKPKNVGMAVIVDNTDGITDIHPRNKAEVGRRLALLADKLVYGKDITAEGPLFKEAVVDSEKSTITISFEDGTTGKGLVIDGDTLSGMKISTAARRTWVTPEYKISEDGKSLILTAPKGSLATYPSAVQYGFYGVPTDGNIKNSEGLPASPFRNYTDDTPTVPDPIAAAEIKAEELSPEHVTLSWGADANSAQLAYYEVLRDNKVIATVGCVPVTDKTVTAGETYSYQLRACDADGAVLSESKSINVSIPQDISYKISVKDGAVAEDTISISGTASTAAAPLDGAQTITIPSKGSLAIDIPSSDADEFGKGAKLTYVYNAETMENTIDVIDGNGNVLSGEFIGANGSAVSYWKKVVVPSGNMEVKDGCEFTIKNNSGKIIYVKEIIVEPIYDGETARIKAEPSNTIELKYMSWFPKAQAATKVSKGTEAVTWNTASWTNAWINPSYLPSGDTSAVTFVTTYYDTTESTTARVTASSTGNLAPVTKQTGEWITNVVYNDAFSNVSPVKPKAYNDNYAMQIQQYSLNAEVNELEVINKSKAVTAEIEMLNGTVHRTMMDYDRASGTIVTNIKTGNAKYLKAAANSSMKLTVDNVIIPDADSSVTIDLSYISASDAVLAYTNTNGKAKEIKLNAGGTEETPTERTIHLKDYSNKNGITLVSGNSELDLVRIRVTNDFGMNSEIVPSAAVDTTPVPAVNLEVKKDEKTTTADAIGIKWNSVDNAAYYVVKRSLGGVTEFTSENISATSYVDKGGANRPEAGPAEADYNKRVNGTTDERYAMAEDSNQKQPVTGAGKGTKIYNSYTGIPLVAGCKYSYTVTAYAKDGSVMAISDAAVVAADKKENTAAIVFDGATSAPVNGYGIEVVNLPSSTEIATGETAGAACWTIKAHNAELGLKLADNSGLVNTGEKKSFRVKYTYLDNHRAFWSAIKLPRNDSKSFMIMLSDNIAQGEWITREIVYTGENKHELISGGNAADIVFKGYFAGANVGLALHSVEISLVEEPVAEVYDITVTRDDAQTTDSQIGLKWVCSDDVADEIKYYRVERVSNGVTEFKTDGEVSDTKYVDKGTSQRPDYGPYETDYTKNSDGKYNISDLNNNRALLSDAGKTTRIFDTYEGIPLVSGGEYCYVVTGYNATGEAVASSAPTKLKTLERENTASIVFEGTPSANLQGYNMRVSSVTNMEVGTYAGITGWTFQKGCDVNSSNLALLLDDESGLTGAAEDTGYLIKVTWGDRFWNALGTARVNLQRTANSAYDTSNFNNIKNYIAMDAGSGSESNKWITREIGYYGKNAHSLSIDDVMADIVINASYAGNYGRFFIKSMEITKWDGPEERPFEINMPSMFTDNMIMQRDSDINMWGRIDGVPYEMGVYSPTTVTAELVDEDGNAVASGSAAADATRFADWSITLDKTVAYEPGKIYMLKLTAETTEGGSEKTSETVTIKNIIFGDVYLCAGQSNMRYGPEYTAWTDYRSDIDGGMFDNDNIRIISNENTTVSDFWETDTVGWRESSKAALEELKFSATASYFGAHLYKDNGNVPIGLISSAVGGASIGTFLVDPVTDGNGATLYKGNSILYKRLIYPYTNGFNEGEGIGIAGILWYQGEADANSTAITSSTYTKAMEQMVNDYRKAFGRADIPFMYVQLAPFRNVDYTQMREAQLNYMLGKNTNNGVPQNVGMAVITDNTDNISDIHPRNKSEVGRRLSLWARKLVYNQDIEYTGPVFEAAEATTLNGADALKITFKEGSVINGLDIKGGVLTGLKIAGADKTFVVPEKWEISDDGKSITVMSSDVENPMYVEYGYYSIPTDATIFNADGLPASPFRNYE